MAIRNVITEQAMISGWSDLPAFGGIGQRNVPFGGGYVSLPEKVEFGPAPVVSHTILADSLTRRGGGEDGRRWQSVLCVQVGRGGGF